jgi:protein SCO1/2
MMKSSRWWGALLLGLAALGWQVSPVQAHSPVPPDGKVSDLVGLDQRLGERVPRDVPFVDEAGRRVRFGAFFGDKPVILALSYFECETLCPLVRSGLVDSLAAIPLEPGRDFEVVVVSIDPAETAEHAVEVKQQVMGAYARPDTAGGWHFLTGSHDAIDTLADAVGFRYAYDEERDEYAHPSGLMVVTPDGTLARYHFGIEYDPRDLRLSLVEASAGRVGSPLDQLLLLCYHYDPTTGKYTLLIMTIVRIAGMATVAGLGALVYWLWRREDTQTAMPG